MTDRMHPQDLRAKMALEFYKLYIVTGTDDPSHKAAIREADDFLGLLERTAKPEAPAPEEPSFKGCLVTDGPARPNPAPTRTCSEVDETAPVVDAWIPPEPTWDLSMGRVDHALRLTTWGRDLARRLRAILNSHAIVSDALAQAVKREDEASAEVDRLKAELAQAKKDLVMGPCLEVITHEHLAQARVEERDRLKPWLRHDENCSGNHSSMPCKCGLRAALEPRP